MDHGSRAPVATLQEVFEGVGLPITVEEARLSMGIARPNQYNVFGKAFRFGAGNFELICIEA